MRTVDFHHLKCRLILVPHKLVSTVMLWVLGVNDKLSLEMLDKSARGAGKKVSLVERKIISGNVGRRAGCRDEGVLQSREKCCLKMSAGLHSPKGPSPRLLAVSPLLCSAGEIKEVNLDLIRGFTFPTHLGFILVDFVSVNVG